MAAHLRRVGSVLGVPQIGLPEAGSLHGQGSGVSLAVRGSVQMTLPVCHCPLCLCSGPCQSRSPEPSRRPAVPVPVPVPFPTGCVQQPSCLPAQKREMVSPRSRGEPSPRRLPAGGCLQPALDPVPRWPQILAKPGDFLLLAFPISAFTGGTFRGTHPPAAVPTVPRGPVLPFPSGVLSHPCPLGPSSHGRHPPFMLL